MCMLKHLAFIFLNTKIMTFATEAHGNTSKYTTTYHVRKTSNVYMAIRYLRPSKKSLVQLYKSTLHGNSTKSTPQVNSTKSTLRFHQERMSANPALHRLCARGWNLHLVSTETEYPHRKMFSMHRESACFPLKSHLITMHHSALYK